MQENLVIVKEERLFLLRKLCQIQGDQDPAVNKNPYNVNHLNSIVLDTDGIIIPKKTARKRCSTDVLNSGETSKFNLFKKLPHLLFLFTKYKNPFYFLDSKPKKKGHAKTTRKIVQPIPLDVNGRPLFPISLGDLTVYSLGEVVSDRIAYHTEDLIYPVGFCSTRLFANLKDPSTKSLYTCKILDGGLRPR